MVALDPEAMNGPKTEDSGTDSYPLRIFQSTLNLLAHVLIGIVVGVCIMFAFRNGVPTGSTNVHIVFCVIGVSITIIIT